MVRRADGPGPGAFDEAQAQAYAAAVDIETAFPHDQVFLELLRHHARGAALDLGGGTGRYAAWLLTRKLVTSAHVIDNSPAMIAACARRGVPGLTTQLDDIATTDLGREQYHIVLARFVLMHIRALDGLLQQIAMSLRETGTLVVVTNVIAGTPPAVATYIDETAGIMQLVLQAQGQPITVSNYVHTQDDYTQAFQRAGLRLAWCELYAPQIVRFAQAPPGITLAHLLLMGKK
jgi:trans-aconitate methyltransferase